MTDNQDRDGRHALARGYVLASRAMSVGLQMIVPIGLGWWADSAWKTSPWLMLLGVVVGFAVAMIELVQLARESSPPTKPRALQSPQGEDGLGGDS